MTRSHHTSSSCARAARETQRSKGQFWTPDWVADFMVAYVLQDRPHELLDPALGEGVFFRAAKRFAHRHHFPLTLLGRETDPAALAAARAAGLTDADLRKVELRDFVLDPPHQLFPAIVANPPYIRHHRLAPALKASLQAFARSATGTRIDGRAGLHVYFLIRALRCLAPGGRLAFIVSADICEGIFARALWQWISSHYRLDAVVTFSPSAAPFPDVDTNALVLCIQHATPAELFSWILCHDKAADDLAAALTGRPPATCNSLVIHSRPLAEALATGLSRSPSPAAQPRFVLGDFASVLRGIVTGDNEFFFLTRARAHQLGIPDSFFIDAVGRTRDVTGSAFTALDLERLERSGRPTRLLCVNGLPFDQMPPALQSYLKMGEQRGIPSKPLIRTRKPWYRMESRPCPPIMFTYLGRRACRFVRNHAHVVPLTCLLCVYPKRNDPDFLERLWSVLSHPATIDNLHLVGKSYGGGAIKVEPRALERLPLPDDLVISAGLDKFLSPKQSSLFDQQSL